MDNVQEVINEIEDSKILIEECDKLYNELQDAIKIAERLEE